MFDFIKTLIQSVRDEEEGQAMIEYALILALVSVVAIGTLTLIGPEITRLLGQVLAALQGAGLPAA
jgi:pilus assembly protein Flp/PilA